MSRIAVLGTYLPRQCGIATFTSDLANTLGDLDPQLTIESIAMSDRNGYDYPDRVSYEISEQDAASYAPAADYINRLGYEVLSVQHEYGIFGGDSGIYLLNLLREAKTPIVTTLHTVLKEPSDDQRLVMDELLQLSERVVVMSEKAVEFLQEVHDVYPGKIDLIPHGIPYIDPVAGAEFRRSLNIQGPMILTFGLLSPDKGIQYVIEAMPRILEEHSGAVYVIVGATHPGVRAHSGESYREGLIATAARLGVSESIRFVDRFVSIEELVLYLGAMDIYITPYLNANQITSGTLAYAVGAGKAVISTPYWYAEELLSEGRGLLVPFRDSDAISNAVSAIQSDPVAKAEMAKRARLYGEAMLWPQVGKRYLESFEKAILDNSNRLRMIVQNIPVELARLDALPAVKLQHLKQLSDDTGILQHALFTTPNRNEGYCVDDNARALMLTVALENHEPLKPDVALLQSRYLSFVVHAFNSKTGRFRNFMDFGRNWLEEVGSEDSQGRSVWALGTVVSRCKNAEHRAMAQHTFLEAAPELLATTSLRTWAYTLLGANEYLQAFPDEQVVQEMRATLAQRLMAQREVNTDLEWPWFEQKLTYANARLAQALMLSGEAIGDLRMMEAGIESLSWLVSQTVINGVFVPIGSNGFYLRGQKRAYFDQQPIEATAAVSAYLSAYRVTGNPVWFDEAKRAFRWFMGLNMVGMKVCDPDTGGCSDGIHNTRLNRNQGAESTLSYLAALIELRDASLPTSLAKLVMGVPDVK